jgi:single-stranded DNA-binding protein
MNEFILQGRIVRDPSLKFSAKGTGIINLTIATAEEKTQFIPVTLFRKNEEEAQKTVAELFKGRLIKTSGRIANYSYVKDDAKMYGFNFISSGYEVVN